MTSWLAEIRHSIRMLRKSPEVTLVVVVAMALAIGATSTVFSVVNGALIQPLPFADADRLVGVWQVDPARPDTWRRAAAGNFDDWRRSSQSFEFLGATVNRSYTLTSFDEPETPLMRQASVGYFEALGVEPALGRLFLPEEDRPGAAPVVLLSHELWQRRFASDPNVVGQTTELDGQAHTIVGVMPQGYINPAFSLDVLPQAWIPLGLADSGLDRRATNHLVVGRLKDGVTVAQARKELEALSLTMAQQYPDSNENVRALVTPLAEAITRSIRPALMLLFGAVSFVLLVACGNVANLLLTRALGRRREIAVRRALGASIGRLSRQLITESLVLALLAGGLGLVLAAWGSGSIHLLLPSGPGTPQVDMGVDRNVILFTLGLSLATGLGFGLVPAVHALKLNLGSGLGVAALRSTEGRSSQRLRHGLVVAEVALSLVLLVGAGLMVRSFVGLAQLDPGFDSEELLTFRVSTRGADYEDGAARSEFFRRVAEGMSTVPGVQSVGLTQSVPFFSGFNNNIIELGDRPVPEVGSEPRVLLRRILPGYLETLGIPLHQGRMLTDNDRADTPFVALISRTMAEQLWPDGDPLGEQVTVRDGRNLTFRIVGIVGDVRSDQSPPDPQPIVYVSMSQDDSPTSMGFAVRAHNGDPMALLQDLQRQVWAVDRGMPVYQVRMTEEQLALIDWQTRFVMSLLGIFAILALGLASTGIYAVLSYAVSRRRREIGIRMALGAQRGAVVAMILRGAAGLAGLGILVGLVGAIGFGQVLQGQLYGVSATDPITYGVLTILLASIALAAAYVPALRATRVDPVSTLQQE